MDLESNLLSPSIFGYSIDLGVPGDFGMVCHRKKQRRKRQKLIIIDLFLDFAKNTTLHGLRYITEVGLTAAEKVFWVITFVISVILCFLLIERVWHKWWFSPVIVSFNERMVPVGEVPFPSVTICPQWKFISNDRSPYNYSSLVRKYFGRNRKKPIENIKGEKEKFEDAMLICDDKNRFVVDRKMSDISVVRNIDEISPQDYDVFLNQCRWRGSRVPCYDMFKKVYTNEGVCFNFNSIYNEDMFKYDSIQNDYLYLDSTDEERKANTSQNKVRRGQENGSKPDLDFMLMEDPSESDEMCNSLSNGFKIYVQHPDDMPQSSLYYYAAIPGQVTSLALKFSVLNTSASLMKYSSELRQCYFPEDRELQYFKRYTPSNCRLECLSVYTYRRCGCVWFHMPHSNSSEICTAQSKKCVNRAQDELASNNLKVNMENRCNCLPSCDSVQYDAEILKTTFDFKKSYNAIRKLRNFTNSAAVEKYNFSRVEIYFKEPRFVSMRRSELFGLTDFLANCGGLLGLFLGFSFLSLVEIFYFCTLRLWCTLRKDIKYEKKQLRESMYQKNS